MTILHLDEQRGWRGGEQQASWLIQGLVQRGHAALVAGRRGSRFLAADYGGSADHGVGEVPRIAAPFVTELDVWSAWKVSRIVRRFAVDILHAHSSHAHSYACMARALAGRGKVVVSRRVSFRPRPGALNRWKYAQADRIIAVSNRVADVLHEYGLTEPQVVVVHSSVDPARLEAVPLSRCELGVPEGVPLLGTAGALVGHKDHENLLMALPAVLREFPDLHLVIAGEGELRPALEAKIAALGLGKSVTLLGHREDVPRILRALDVYVSSSWSEGLGTSVLEALACEVPVVATAAGGVSEMVLHEKTGLLVPVRDPAALAASIVRALREPEHAKAMGRAGRALVLERFSVDRMVESTLKVYEGLLQ